MSVEKLITDHIDIWSSALQTRSSAGRGSNGKIDLYGIKKLRELILELAVRGKLVPQDPNDEPASELLKRIAAEKAELVKQGKIKKQKPLPEISEDEKQFELPEGWEWVRFGNVYEMEYGDNLPQDKRTNTGEYNVYGSNGVVGTHNEPCVNSPCIVIGRKGSAGALNLSLNAGCWVTDVAYSTIPPVAMNLDFVYLQFHTLGLDLLGKGIKPGLNRRDAYALTIAIPPQNEQKNIVSKVKELMSLCDQLEQQSLTSLEAHLQLVETLLATLTDSQNAEELAENWARISQHFDTLFTTEASIDALKQTILQLAVMGKLVPQDPNDEPASELLKRIEQEKAQLVKEGKIKKQKPLPPVSDENENLLLPPTWSLCRLQDVTNLITDGKHGDCNDRPNSGFYFLSAKDINGGKLNYEYARQIEPADFLEVHQRTDLQVGDICMVNTGATVGKLAIVDNAVLAANTTFQKSVAVIKACAPLVLNLYLYIFLESQTQALRVKSGGSAINNLLLGDLKNKIIPFPPLNEQYRIVKKVNEFVFLCDQLKSRLQSAQQTQLHLADALTDAALN